MEGFHKFHIKQLALQDNGAVCLKIILNYFGSDTPLEILREMIGTREKATTLFDILNSARELGLRGKGYQADIEFIKKLDSPFILHIQNERGEVGFWVCYSYDKQEEKFVISNPENTNVKSVTEAYLNKHWLSKYVLTLFPTEALKQVPINKSNKQQLIKKVLYPDKNLFLSIFILGVITATLTIAIAIVLKVFVDQVLPSHDLMKFIICIGLLMAIFSVRNGVTYIMDFFLLRQSRDLATRLSDMCFSAIFTMPKSLSIYLGQEKLLKKLKLSEELQKDYSQTLNRTLINILIVLFAIITMFFLKIIIGVFALVIILCFMFYVYRLNQRTTKKRMVMVESEDNLERIYVDCISNIENMKLSNTLFVFKTAGQSLIRLKQSAIFQLFMTIVDSKYRAKSFGVFLLGGNLLFSSVYFLNSVFSLGEFVASIVLTVLLTESITGIVESVAPFQKLENYVNRLYVFFDTVNDFVPVHEGEGESVKNFSELKITNLNFRLPNKRRLFQNISLHCKKGEIVVLKGANGCGKSMLLEMIQKNRTPTTGSIAVNGADLKSKNERDWKTELGLVPQRAHFTRGTLIDNITMGNPTVDQKKFESFIAGHGFDTYFNELPEGLASILDNSGSRISEGHKKLICLARALWKKPNLLLLDEPTSGMDEKMEEFVLQLLNEKKDEMAILICTNQSDSGKYANRLYTLVNGEISMTEKSTCCPSLNANPCATCLNKKQNNRLSHV